MDEKRLIDSLGEVDALLGKCINPALTRIEHYNIQQVMQIALARIKLSYKLEKEKLEQEKPEEVK